MIIIVSLTVTTILCLLQFQHVGASTDSNNGKQLTNETFLEDPDPQTLVNALSNGLSLSYYTTPKNNDLIITEGNWTIERLHELHPSIIEKKEPENSKEVFFIKKTIVIGKDAELDILNCKVLLNSSSKKDNIPAVIITYGKTDIINSTIMSWDPKWNRPDHNPYHPRSFLVAHDGGTVDVVGSTINHMGFSLAGAITIESSLAALNYYNTTGFTITKSTIANNLYGFFSDESYKFKITNNQVYDNIGYGLDPHTGSKDFIIDSNHISVNGKQGIICSFRCENVTITNNIVEYNTEGIGLHWLTNSSTVKNNIVKYNKEFGIFIKDRSYDNTIENNTVLGNGHGIGLLDNSNENTIRSNTVVGNILATDQIYEDDDSKSNLVEDNNYG